MERRRLRGFVRRPNVEEIIELAAEEYIFLSDEEAQELSECIDESLNHCDRIDELPQPRFEIKYKQRDMGYRPTPEEDPYNLFIRKCEIKGAPSGKLAGKRVAVKDNIAVAGVPMTNGSRAMIDFIPDFDAVVVERLLEAGATIVGKLNQADMSLDGTSETSPFGIVRNPRNPEYSPGGSSSAQGAVVLTGDADIALGVDQGGSGRIPPAWTGVCAIKATHGLVPSFGIYHMDHTVDFICPAARTVEEVALALEVIAGEDPRDPQWVRNVRKEEYTQAVKKGLSGLKIGVVKESLEGEELEEDVKQAVEKVLWKVKEQGAIVHESSIPLWKDSWSIWTSVFAHSMSVMYESAGQGYYHGGYAIPQFAEAYGKARKTRSRELPPLYILMQILGKYLRREYDSVYFAKGQNLRHVLRGQIDALLNEHDVLITPAAPVKPFKFLEYRPGLKETVQRVSMAQNTCPLNVTGHPAMVIPCGLGENNLPISLQIIGKHFEESTVFKAAYNFELLGCHWERLGS